MLSDEDREVLAAATAGRCTQCLRPIASEEDWDRYGDDEGAHLCWDDDLCCWSPITTALDLNAAAVEAIVARHVTAALNEAAVSIGALLQPNPINGDGSNYTLNRVLHALDMQAGTNEPSTIAAAELKRRENESYARMLELNAELTKNPAARKPTGSVADGAPGPPT